MQLITIGVVDDQALFRQGLTSLLKKFSGFNVVMEACDGISLLNLLKTAPRVPEIILLDLNMPGLNGVELNEILHRDYPSIKVIIVTMYSQQRFVRKMIEAGACGYLIKNSDIDELVNCIETVHKTGFYFSPEIIRALRQALHYKEQSIRNINSIPIELTPREQEVLKLICREMTNTEIANELNLSARTVDGHRNNLLYKTGCRNTAGLVIFAVRHSLFEVEF